MLDHIYLEIKAKWNELRQKDTPSDLLLWLVHLMEEIESEKEGENSMTVKELIEKLEKLNPDALVYRIYDDDEGVAFTVLDVKENVLEGSAETVLIC